MHPECSVCVVCEAVTSKNPELCFPTAAGDTALCLCLANKQSYSSQLFYTETEKNNIICEIKLFIYFVPESEKILKLLQVDFHMQCICCCNVVHNQLYK